jgi:hypothetical protein
MSRALSVFGIPSTITLIPTSQLQAHEKTVLEFHLPFDAFRGHCVRADQYIDGKITWTRHDSNLIVSG